MFNVHIEKSELIKQDRVELIFIIYSEFVFLFAQNVKVKISEGEK